MQASSYLERPTHSPTSFGLAFTLTGAGLAALLLIKPIVFDPPVSPPTVVDNINVPVAPPPPVPQPRPVDARHPQPQPQPRPEIPETVVPRTPIDTGLVLPPGPIGGGIAPSGGPIVLPPDPIAPPVIVGARYDPRFVRDQQPPYPAALQREEVEGLVTVRVQVGTDGRVLAVEPVRADDERFFTATRDWALRRWRFLPETRDGKPVTGWRTMKVRFTIER